MHLWLVSWGDVLHINPRVEFVSGRVGRSIYHRGKSTMWWLLENSWNCMWRWCVSINYVYSIRVVGDLQCKTLIDFVLFKKYKISISFFWSCSAVFSDFRKIIHYWKDYSSGIFLHRKNSISCWLAQITVSLSCQV